MPFIGIIQTHYYDSSLNGSEIKEVQQNTIPADVQQALQKVEQKFMPAVASTPILKKYHAKATQYVISGFLNNSNHLTTAQLQEIVQDGLVEIGAHTVHHVWLKGLSLKKVSTEVFQSKVTLGKLIGKPVTSFAYPYGAFDEQATQLVKESGFGSAVSTIPGVDQKQEYRLFLYRLRPGGRVGQSLLDWLDQVK